MTQVKSLVITGFGINCEEEMAAAYELAGATAEIVHLNEILHGKVSIQDYDILNFPGGFSFGDDLASGKVVANKIKYKKLPTGDVMLDEIRKFLDDGKYILGVCNGFQMLVRMGLLPDTTTSFETEATLSNNNSGKFEDRWVYCKVNKQSQTPFLKDIDIIALPARHGEGKLILMDDDMRTKVAENNLDCLSYCTADGTITGAYPANPNGADLNCAGLTNLTGQVLGLMPHPEAYLSLYNNPDWGQIKRRNPEVSEDGEGLKIFENIVEHVMDKKLATA
jgi:phosphoribosylformylglycinamidine synthase subunit PurQ / glutaminase